jgi:type IV pilus assembly protein PilB
VEYQIEGIMQCSINTKIGLTYNDTLKSIVRQDPDIIVLGEIRDKTSAETAIQAALTGHKVFTTFHTEDAVGGLLRLMNMEIETFLISSTVISMVAQRLVRKICPECKTVHKPSPKTLFLLGLNPDDLRDHTFYKGRGCDHCHNTGYKGRVAIYELLVMNEKVKDAILERKTSYYIRRIAIQESGLISLQESGIAKVVKGITTFEEVLQKAPFSIRPRPVKEIFAHIGEEL